MASTWRRAPKWHYGVRRVGEQHYRWCWTGHHLLLDVVRGDAGGLNEVFAIYEALLQRQELTLPPARSSANTSTGTRVRTGRWRSRSGDRCCKASAATPLTIARTITNNSETDAFAEQHTEVAPATTAALKGLAKLAGVTLNLVLQSGWALLLSRYGGGDDVVFGEILACAIRNQRTPRGWRGLRSTRPCGCVPASVTRCL